MDGKLNVYQKINEVKKVVDVFEKDASTSGKGAYTYTSGSQILKAIKDKMQEVGLLFLPVKTEHRGYREFQYKNSYGDLKTDFLVDGKLFYEWINIDDPQDRQTVEFEYYGQQADLSKAFGSALTYSERYLLLKSLGVPTDEDDPDKVTQDKRAASKPPAKAQNQPSAAQNKTAKGSGGATAQSPAKPAKMSEQAALAYTVDINNKTYVLGNMNEAQLDWVLQRAGDDATLKEAVNTVFAYRLKQSQDNSDIPF